MAKAPAMQFYVRDWLTDPQLSMASPEVRGMWIDFLCLMWLAPQRGRLVVPNGDLSKLSRNVTVTLCNKFVTELKRYKFGDYRRYRNGTVVISNRRMRREFRQVEQTRTRVRKHRAKKAAPPCNADVTPYSASATASATARDKEIPPPKEEEISPPTATDFSSYTAEVRHIAEATCMAMKRNLIAMAPELQQAVLTWAKDAAGNIPAGNVEGFLGDVYRRHPVKHPWSLLRGIAEGWALPGGAASAEHDFAAEAKALMERTEGKVRGSGK